MTTDLYWSALLTIHNREWHRNIVPCVMLRDQSSQELHNGELCTCSKLYHIVKGQSTNTCWGRPNENRNLHKTFFGILPFRLQKISGPYFFSMKIMVKGSQLDKFCPKAIVYWYLEFKLSYLKSLKLFSVRVKELSEPTVLWRKGDGF